MAFLLLLVTLAVAMSVVLAGRGLGRRQYPVRDAHGRPINFHYQPAPLLVSHGEEVVWGLLREMHLGQTAVCPKVRVEDIIQVRPGLSPGQTLQLRGYTRARHVDFLLVDNRHMPMLVVEVDGPHHQEQHQRWRDAVVDGALKSAGVPVLRLHYGENWRDRLIRWREFADGVPSGGRRAVKP